MTEALSYEIRPARPSDEAFLREMLYQSLYVEEGSEPFPRDVLERPDIARYVKDWGRAGDLGFIAVESSGGRRIGAAWSRPSVGDDKGFAYIDERTPELGVALFPEYRGRGVGTALLERLLEEAKKFYPAIALSVSPNNPAIRLYERLGFETVDVRDGHPVMRRDLRARSMSMASATLATERPTAFQVILAAGLTAGVLDLTAALVTNGLRGASPTRVLQSIASGLLGAGSYAGGAGTAALGVGLHFVIALGAAAVYYAASRRLGFLSRRAFVAGPLYGVAVYLFMNLVVLPLSAVPFKVSFRPDVLATGLVVHVLCVGLPIALVVRHYSKNSRARG